MSDESDARLMAEISARLVEASARALGPWVEAAVAQRAGDRAAELASAATAAGERCAEEVPGTMAALLTLDIDAQRTTPLGILRSACRYPAAVLAAAGVPAPSRDPFDERANPDDRYEVGPATWADLGEEVGELGIAWGAAKAHLHKRRHLGR